MPDEFFAPPEETVRLNAAARAKWAEERAVRQSGLSVALPPGAVGAGVHRRPRPDELYYPLPVIAWPESARLDAELPSPTLHGRITYPIDVVNPDSDPHCGDPWPRHLFMAEVSWLALEEPVLIPDERDRPAPPPPEPMRPRDRALLILFPVWAAAALFTYLFHRFYP